MKNILRKLSKILIVFAIIFIPPFVIIEIRLIKFCDKQGLEKRWHIYGVECNKCFTEKDFILVKIENNNKIECSPSGLCLGTSTYPLIPIKK